MSAPQLYIDGEWTGATSGQSLDLIDPATEEVMTEVRQDSSADWEQAMVAAGRSSEDGARYKRTPGELGSEPRWDAGRALT